MAKPRVRPLRVKFPDSAVSGLTFPKLWTCYSGSFAAIGRSPLDAQNRFFRGEFVPMQRSQQ